MTYNCYVALEDPQWLLELEEKGGFLQHDLAFTGGHIDRKRTAGTYKEMTLAGMEQSFESSVYKSSSFFFSVFDVKELI